MSRGGIPPSPLPQRDGVDAVRLRMPQSGPWRTLREHLVDRLPLPAADVEAMLRDGRVVDASGRPVGVDEPFRPRDVVWTHREFPDEIPVPFPIRVLAADERIVVLDKPHFLATMPRGRHVTQSALARARVQLGLPRLAPAHRLDRLTAGVLLLTTQQRWRGAYQSVFAAGRVHKEYLAVAPLRADLDLPTTVRSHLVKGHGQLQAREDPAGEPNSETRIELLAQASPLGLGLYRLTPATGRTHQLRRHLASLGIPIVGDPLYPVVHDVDPGDFTTPLSLVARAVSFTDPVDGTLRRFVTHRRPPAWPGPDPIGLGLAEPTPS